MLADVPLILRRSSLAAEMTVLTWTRHGWCNLLLGVVIKGISIGTGGLGSIPGRTTVLLGLATAATLLSCVATAISCGDGTRHL